MLRNTSGASVDRLCHTWRSYEPISAAVPTGVCRRSPVPVDSTSPSPLTTTASSCSSWWSSAETPPGGTIDHIAPNGSVPSGTPYCSHRPTVMPYSAVSRAESFSNSCIANASLAGDLLDPGRAGRAVVAAPALLQPHPPVREQVRSAGHPPGRQLAAVEQLDVRGLDHAVRAAGADQPPGPHRPAGELGPDQVAGLVVAADRGGAVAPGGLGRLGAEPPAVVVEAHHAAHHRTGSASSTTVSSCRSRIELSTSAARTGSRVRLASGMP